VVPSCPPSSCAMGPYLGMTAFRADGSVAADAGFAARSSALLEAASPREVQVERGPRKERLRGLGQLVPVPCRGDDAAGDSEGTGEGDVEAMIIDEESSGNSLCLSEEERSSSKQRRWSSTDSAVSTVGRHLSLSSASTADTALRRLSDSSEALRLFDVEKHYTLGPKLGQGFHGSVHMATRVDSGKGFALKTVNVAKDRGSGDVEAEIITLSMLDNPYIVKLHAFFQEGSAFHLVMDLCTGDNMAMAVTNHVRMARKTNRRYNSGLSPQIAGRYAWQMLNGLEFLHRCGLMHRDIKPENYLLEDDTPNSRLKLADFGFACHIGPEEKLRRSVGSTCFAAPELLRGSYDQAADVWSLGVTCFWMCTNTYPFGGFDDKEYLQNVRAGTVEQSDAAWKQHLPRTRAMVLKMLTSDPDKRPSVKQLLADNAWLKAFDRQAGVDGCCTIS